MLNDPSAPILSAETLAKITALYGSGAIKQGRLNHIAIRHDDWCLKALREGATHCTCKPDVEMM